jgi:hypothetical protein
MGAARGMGGVPTAPPIRDPARRTAAGPRWPLAQYARIPSERSAVLGRVDVSSLAGGYALVKWLLGVQLLVGAATLKRAFSGESEVGL